MSVARTRARSAGDPPDQVVALAVAEPVVDLLEAVDVDDHHRPLAAVTGAEGDMLVELGTEAAAIEQPGQRVVVGQVTELGLGPLGPLERSLDDRAVLGFQLASTSSTPSRCPGNTRSVHRRKVFAEAAKRSVYLAKRREESNFGDPATGEYVT